MLDRTHVLPETFLDLPRPQATSLLEVSGTLYFCYIWLLDFKIITDDNLHHVPEGTQHDSSIRGTQRLFSVKYLFGEASNA